MNMSPDTQNASHSTLQDRSSERLQKKRELTDAERDQFFTLSLDMLCISSSDGYFKWLNPAFSQTLGWTIDELLARSYVEFVHPDDLAATIREVERQVAAGEKVFHFENRYRHKDGSWRVLSWKSVPQGELMYAVARDVTEHNLLERALQETNAELERRVSASDVLYRHVVELTLDGIWIHTCACRKLDSCVAMMQPTDHGLGNDPAKPLDGAADRCVLAQGQVSAGLVVVAGVTGHDAAQMCLA